MTKRPGFTLVELLIALTLALVVGGMTTLFLLRQQRFSVGIADVVSAHNRLQDAVNVLAADLRSAPAPSQAIRDASDTAITFFSSVGASVLCTDPAGSQITVVPDTLMNGVALTDWVASPDSGDVALVYHDTSAVAPAAGWLRYTVVHVAMRSAATACPPSSGFTTPAGAHNASAYQFTLDAPPPLAVTAGAPIRLVRLVRYSMYRASDRSWYLGYHRCNARDATCSIVQPVSGPYAHGTTSPLTLHYYSPQGIEITQPSPSALASIARIDIDLHGATRHHVLIPGLASADRDSVLATVSFRNRR